MFPDDHARTTGTVMANGVLPWRLINHPTTRDNYAARLRALLEEIWNEEALASEIDRMAALITPVADPAGALGLSTQLDEVRRFVAERRAAVLTELGAGPLTWSEPLREPPCFETVAELSGDFSTTWGTIGQDPFVVGDGTFGGLVHDVVPEVAAVGAVAGFDTNPEANGLPLIYVVAYLHDGTVLLLIVQLGDPVLLQPGALVTFNWTDAIGVLLHYYPATDESDVNGFVAGGTLSLSEASTVDAEPVVGSFDVTVVETGW